MRRAQLVSLLAIAAVSFGAADLRAQQRIVRGMRAAADATIRVHNLSGSTSISGWDRDSVAAIATLEPGASRVYIGGTPSAIKLGVEPPAGGTQQETRLEVRVPRGSVVWVKSAGAPIAVDGVEGGLDLYSVSGTIDVRGAPATLRAESMDGAVRLDVRSQWARAKSASGPIEIAGEIGDVAATSVSGTVRVSASRQARARLETVTGEIVVTGRPTRGGAWEIETHSGSVTLALAPDVDAEIEVHSFGGEVISELGRIATRSVDELSGSEHRIVAGSGGTSIAVRTFKGSVRVRPSS